MTVHQYATDIVPVDINNALTAYRQGTSDARNMALQQYTQKHQETADQRDETTFAQQQDAYKITSALQKAQAVAQLIGSVRDGDAQGLEAAKARAVSELGLPADQVAHLTVADLPRLRMESGQTLKELQAQAQRANIRQSDASAAASYASAAKDRAAAAQTGQIDPIFAKSLANYEVDLPSPRSPNYQSAVAAAKAINPDFNAAEFTLRKNAKNAFRSGPDGRAVQYINTAMDHLKTLEGLATALKSGNVQLINRANAAWQEQFGSAAPTNLNAASQIVGNEVIKGIVSGQNAEADRAEARKAFTTANSPEQISGAANTVRALLGGQLKGYERRYNWATKAKDFRDGLSEDARTLLDRKAPPTGKITKQQYDALPSGTPYIAPDGSQRVKP